MTFDPFDPQPDYVEFQLVNRIGTEGFVPGGLNFDAPYIAGVDAVPEDLDPDTHRLALESCQRWLNNYRLSPAMRLRALRSVVQSALSSGTA